MNWTSATTTGADDTTTADLASSVAMDSSSSNSSNSSISSLSEVEVVVAGASKLEEWANVMLPSTFENRRLASSVLLTLISLLGAVLLILAVRRPLAMLRRAPPPAQGRTDEWEPINAQPAGCCGPPRRAGARLPPTPPACSYNTFGLPQTPEDVAWAEAKRDWHAAINAAKQLERARTPGGEL